MKASWYANSSSANQPFPWVIFSTVTEEPPLLKTVLSNRLLFELGLSLRLMDFLGQATVQWTPAVAGGHLRPFSGGGGCPKEARCCRRPLEPVSGSGNLHISPW
ncbi:hypothetical protein Hdeb2414_s0025g00666761 [Helianthus debilis subsp. tardiflorus]